MEPIVGANARARQARQERVAMSIRVVLLAMLLAGCLPFGHQIGDRAELATLAADLVRVVEKVDAGDITWVGLRDASGEQTEATRALDDYLVSALVRAGIRFALADSSAAKWAADSVVEAKGETGYLLGGRMQEDADWMYVRIFIIGAEGREIVQSKTQKIAARHVRDEVTQRASSLGGEGLPLEVELHVVVMRSEGGIRRRVGLREGISLREGDAIQVRYRLSRDAQVYCFLYSSESEVITLVPDEYIYSGLLHYGPSENGLTTLGELDRVYTLYFLAGPSLLEENEGEFFERLGELVEQGQVDRFVGLEKQDNLLVSYLRRSLQGEAVIETIRANADLPKGEAETFVYSDGTRLQSQAERLKGTPLIVRALSFSVQ